MDVQNLQKKQDLEKNIVDLYLKTLKIFNEWQRIQRNKNEEKSEEEKKKSKEVMAHLGFKDEKVVDLQNALSYVKNIGDIVEKKVELQQEHNAEKKEIIFSHRKIICLMIDFVQLCIKHNAYVTKGLMGKGDKSLPQHPWHDYKFFATNEAMKEKEEVDMLSYRDIKLTDIEKKILTLEKVTANYASIQQGRIMKLNEVEKLFNEETLTPIS